MNITARRIIQKLVVAVTLGVAAIATWAVTDSGAPAIEVAATAAPQA